MSRPPLVSIAAAAAAAIGLTVAAGTPALASGRDTARAQDAAGNWSAPSNADPVTGYRC